MKKLRIAIFCTNEWPTPPPENTFYAPLWIAYFIAEGLAKRGHEVYYYGSKESKISCHLVSDNMAAIKYNKELQPYLADNNEKAVNFYEQLAIGRIYRDAADKKLDIINIHPYRRAVQYAGIVPTPTVFTLHDPIEGFGKYVLEYTKKQPNSHIISISNSQRKPAPGLNYAATVYNGLNLKKYEFNPKPQNYFVAAGRFVPEKGIDIACQIAKKMKIKLKFVGGLAKGNYWDKEIKPYLSSDIKYQGMLKYYQMGDFLNQGRALLYPLRWEEPFGLIMTEAMAGGTPVIAFNHGSVPELIKDGVTGFIVKTIPEMIRAIKKIDTIDRRACREWVEQKFTTETMVDGYERAFYMILSKSNANHER